MIAYQLYEDMAGMPSTYHHLRVRLFMEQSRLLRWGDKLGLIEDRFVVPSQILRLDRNLIIDVLFEIQSALTGCAALQTAYDMIVPSKSNVLPSLESSIQKSFRERFLEKTLAVVEKSKEAPKPMGWALGKQDDFERLIERLIGFNDSIEGLLAKDTMEDLRDSQYQANMLTLQLHDKVDQLLEFSKALDLRRQTLVPNVAQGGLLLTSGPPTSGAGSGIARLAKFKARDIQISHESGSQHHLLLDGRALELANTSRNGRTNGHYQGKSIWVEWREPLAREDYQRGGRLDYVVEDRIGRLAALLNVRDKPPEFGTPFCLGYVKHYDDPSCQYGLVYETPQDCGNTTAPVSLNELLAGSRPSLTKRVALAHALARCMMYLHSVNWLHKGFRSSNIVFPSTSDSAPDLAAPMLAGFDYARPDFEEEVTEAPPAYTKHDIYRHPTTLGIDRERTVKSHDIYSLGVVMVEIAHWRKIDDVLKLTDSEAQATRAIRGARKMLLAEQHLKDVAGSAGETYRDAVRICLAGGSALGIQVNDDESDQNVGVAIQRTFSEMVVDMLGNARI